jgi:hypothetical protein
MNIRTTLAVAVGAAALAVPAHAQTDYYNTDAGRPLRIEDAYAVERYAFELQLAPLRLERSSGGAYTWEIEPEIAYGILPRTQLEVSLPFAVVDAGGEAEDAGIAGVGVAVLHNLNVETTTLPALAIAADATFPVGSLGPDDTYASLKAMATRTFGTTRFHLNGEYTFGPDPDAGDDAGEASRWMAGLAADRTLPLRSLLLTAGAFAEEPLRGDLRWSAEAGFRYQLSPTFNIDGGIGRVLTGDDQGWYVTFGTAYAFALRSLMPVPRR